MKPSSCSISGWPRRLAAAVAMAAIAAQALAADLVGQPTDGGDRPAAGGVDRCKHQAIDVPQL